MCHVFLKKFTFILSATDPEGLTNNFVSVILKEKMHWLYDLINITIRN